MTSSLRTLCTSALLAICAAPQGAAQGQPLAKYDFINESMSDSTNNPDVTASDITANRDVMYWADNGFTNICFGSAWRSQGGYLEFTVAPANSNERLNLTELDIDYGGHGANGDVNRMEVYADEDPGPGGDNFQTLIFGDTGLAQDYDIDLTTVAFLQQIEGPVTFRIEFFRSGSTGSNSNHEVDHFRLDGTVEQAGNPPSGDPCSGHFFQFGPEWSDSHYAAPGFRREWFFPTFANGSEIACIENGNDHNHGDPTIWSKNDCPIGCRRLEFIMKGRNNDDDSMGFTLGFCAGDETDPNADYLAVIWNGDSSQTDSLEASCEPSFSATRPDGLSLVRVTGTPDPIEFWAQDDFDLSCSPIGSGLEVLTEGITLAGTGWDEDVENEVAVEMLSFNLKVWINGTLEIDRDGDYTPYLQGCFGFYNQSQFADYYEYEVSPLVALAEAENYGDGLAGCDGVPSLTIAELPRIGSNPAITLGVGNSTPTISAFIWSLAPGDFPLFGGSLLVSPPFAAITVQPIPVGGFTFNCLIPNDCAQAGVEFFLQGLVGDPGLCAPEGISMSRGLRARIGL